MKCKRNMGDRRIEKFNKDVRETKKNVFINRIGDYTFYNRCVGFVVQKEIAGRWWQSLKGCVN